MMSKLHIILQLIVLVLLSSLTSASFLTSDNDLMFYWDFDQASNPIIDMKSNSHAKVNLTCSVGTSFQQEKIDSSTDYSISFDGSSYCFNNSDFNSLYLTLNQDNWTVIIWANVASIGSPDRFIFATGELITGRGISHFHGADPNMRAWVEDTVDLHQVTIAGDFSGKNLMRVIRQNSTGLGFFNGTTNSTSFSGFTADTNNIVFGDNGIVLGADMAFTANRMVPSGTKIGMIAIINRSLENDELNDIAFNGILEAGESATASPTIIAPSPINNAINTTNVTLNVSHSTGNNDVRYYLYFGESTPLNESNLYLDNVTRTAEEYRNFTTNVSDGTYFYKWKVQNITNGIFSANTTLRTWTLDSTSPIITIHPNNAFNVSGVSSINQYADFLFVNLTITDESDLFGFLINVTQNGVSYFNFTNEALTGQLSFNYTKNISTLTWPIGVFDIEVSASDSHTASKIDDYDVKNGIRKLTFNTAEGNHIEISSDGSATSTTYEKKKDRYEFGWNYMLKDSTRKFTIESESKIAYLPKTKYIGHFVVGGSNWIDFEGLSDDYSVKKVNDYKYEITFINLPLKNQLISKSLGGVNKVTENFIWYRGNYTTTSPLRSVFGDTETFLLNMSRNLTHVRPNATFTYDGSIFPTSSTSDNDYIAFTRDIIITKPSGTSEVINFSWNVNITQSGGGTYNFTIPSSLNVSESILDNCSIYNTSILRITGKDEETDANVNTILNILFTSSDLGNLNTSFELNGATNYTFCTNSEDNFTINSIMEYGDGIVYTHKKYYLNDFSIDTSIENQVFLYHLNNSKASEIVFTVFDTTTGDKVSGAFIKILRFYPGENVFRIVEIAKTDETGQTLGKMVLADVFYKFIIEAPAGVIKLETDVLRILSLTRSFGISFVTDVLDTWDKIHGVSTSVTCIKGTKTCRITWSDTSNIVQDATLEVWRTTGLADSLLSSQTTTAASGTISYTIIEDTSGKAYTAKGFLESNTGTSLYGVGISSLIFSDNPFFTDDTHRLASLFPLFLLVVVIVFALIDWGVIGIVVGSLLGLIIGSIIGILPIDPFYLISFILMGGILIYRLSK